MRQNRVTPRGGLIADPARGLVYGNRGCLHDAAGRIRRAYAVKRWIACRLEFRGRHRRPLMQPGRFTELLFLDEATALAAGHRPCSLCRRADYDLLGALWRELHPGDEGADAIDARLHDERLAPGGGARARLRRPLDDAASGRARALLVRRLHDAAFDELPDGSFVLRDGEPWLVAGGELLRWSPRGYDARAPRPAGGRARLITPPSLVELLRVGGEPLVPRLHPSAAAGHANGGH